MYKKIPQILENNQKIFVGNKRRNPFVLRSIPNINYLRQKTGSNVKIFDSTYIYLAYFLPW